MIVLSTKHEVPVKFKDVPGVTLWVSPLRVQEKQLISEVAVKAKGGAKTENGMRAVFLAVKYGLKRADGLKNLDGSDYQLEFEKGDSHALTDDCTEDMLNLPCGFGLSTVVSNLSYGALNADVEGAKVDLKKAVVKKK